MIPSLRVGPAHVNVACEGPLNKHDTALQLAVFAQLILGAPSETLQRLLFAICAWA